MGRSSVSLCSSWFCRRAATREALRAGAAEDLLEHHSEDHLHHVCSPPHEFRECPDGSLEIRASIGAVRTPQDPPGDHFVWHGYLDEGHVWRDA